MVTQVWYNKSDRDQDGATRTMGNHGKRRPGRPRKGDKMTPSVATTKDVQRTVFDLAAFDDVKLVKTVTLPSKPATVEEALSAVGNDTAALLAVIYDGLVERATEKAREDIAGFRAVDEDGKVATEDYHRIVTELNPDGTSVQREVGKFADEDTGKKINAAILSLAKMQAGSGNFKDLPATRKRELKESATNFLRSNPAMLASIQS